MSSIKSAKLLSLELKLISKEADENMDIQKSNKNGITL